MDKQEKINLISLIIIVGFTVAIIYHYLAASYYQLGYPHNTFLFNPNDQFNDFFNHLKITLNPYWGNIYKGVYFPFFYILLGLFSNVYPIILFNSAFSIFLLSFFGICYYYLNNKSKLITFQNAFVFTFLSYPMLFLLDRGNFEAFTFIFLFLFVFFYPKHPRLSLLFLIFPIASKAIPAIFLLLPLSDKKYKDVFITIFIVGILTLGSYALLPGGFVQNLTNHFLNLRLQDQYYVFNNKDRELGISLFALIKYFLVWIFPNQPEELLSVKIYSVYLPISVIFGLIIAIVFYPKKMAYWKKITLLVCAMNLLPAISMDYKLINIFIPIFLFIASKEKKKTDCYFAILFTLLLIPKQYYLPFYNYNSISSVLNPILMILLVFQIFHEELNLKIHPRKVLVT
jgi:hypothetical protein